MGKYSERIYPQSELRNQVNIKVLPQKIQIYPRFKDLVKDLGSDVCFVTMSLWEAFLNAMDQNPPADQPIEMKFLRQNVQINIGCQINYNPRKARRYPQPEVTGFPFHLESEKNIFFPQLLDQWESLGERQKIFWRQRLEEAGIISPPSPSTGESRSTIKKIYHWMVYSIGFGIWRALKRLLGKKN